MKTKKELNVLKEELENVNKKLAELTEEELAHVTGGIQTQELLRNDGRIWIPKKLEDAKALDINVKSQAN